MCAACPSSSFGAIEKLETALFLSALDALLLPLACCLLPVTAAPAVRHLPEFKCWCALFEALPVWLLLSRTELLLAAALFCLSDSGLQLLRPARLLVAAAAAGPILERSQRPRLLPRSTALHRGSPAASPSAGGAAPRRSCWPSPPPSSPFATCPSSGPSSCSTGAPELALQLSLAPAWLRSSLQHPCPSGRTCLSTSGARLARLTAPHTRPCLALLPAGSSSSS